MFLTKRLNLLHLFFLSMLTLPSVVSAGLLHEYEFLGNGNDSVGTANGVVGAQVSFDPNVPPALQQAAVFPNFVGAPGQITAANVTELGTGDFSIAFWVRRDLNQFFHGIADSFDNSSSTDGGWEAFIFPQDIVALRVEDVNGNQDLYNTASTIADTCWHHVAVSVDRDDPNGVKWYVDGTFDAAQNPTFVSGSIESNLGTMIIGSLDAGAGLSGALGLVQIYDHALNPTEVQNLVAIAPPDEDNDGVFNCDDVCPGFDDTIDTDGDGIPDGCDTPTVHNITQATNFFLLQDAIDAAVDGDVIEAGPQTYFESIVLDKAITLRSSSGDPNDTIIDGTGHLHVVRSFGVEPNTILEGFTITGGKADQSGPVFNASGGGMLNENSSPTVNRCIFRNNIADDGGGMWNFFSSPRVMNCIFENNQAINGGAIKSTTFSFPQISHCRFIQNTADFGAAIFNGGFSPIDEVTEISDCVFSNNQANINGGGILNDFSLPTISRCLFENNQAVDGAGMYNENSHPEVSDCIFRNNQVTSDGGAIFDDSGSLNITDCLFDSNVAIEGGGMANASADLNVNNCTFINNKAMGSPFSDGGAMNNDSVDSATISNCLFINNLAADDGGGIFTTPTTGATQEIINCTFVANVAGDSGGGIFNFTGIHSVANSIFWQNSDTGGMDESAQIHIDSVVSTTVDYSNIMGGWSGTGTGNINTDPLFVDADGPDDDPNTIIDNDYRLAIGSPCIDAGDSNAVPADTLDLNEDTNTAEPVPFDLAGRIRNVDDLPTVDTGINRPPVVDMGAYEHQCDGNLDAVGSVTMSDFGLLTQLWLVVDCGFCSGADFDGDGDVTLSDGLIQWTNWLCGI